jgi:hypothetical protein
VATTSAAGAPFIRLDADVPAASWQLAALA